MYHAYTHSSTRPLMQWAQTIFLHGVSTGRSTMQWHTTHSNQEERKLWKVVETVPHAVVATLSIFLVHFWGKSWQCPCCSHGWDARISLPFSVSLPYFGPITCCIPHSLHQHVLLFPLLTFAHTLQYFSNFVLWYSSLSVCKLAIFPSAVMSRKKLLTTLFLLCHVYWLCVDQTHLLEPLGKL